MNISFLSIISTATTVIISRMLASRTFRVMQVGRTARSVQMRSMATPKIIYTETDEAPALATYSLLPIIRTFGRKVGIDVEKSDISLSARIISHFPQKLTPAQRMNDNLADLGELCKKPEANIIKLPNVSASIPQLTAAITELRLKG